MIGWPATIEAMATVALAVTAGLQWRAMRKNNETMAAQAQQERDRWNDEDKIRKEANKPKAVFGFSDQNRANLKLSCANLGTVGFLVVGMQVAPLVGDPVKIFFGKGNEILVPVGEEKQAVFDRDKYRKLNEKLCGILRDTLIARHLGIKLILQGPLETVETNFEAYRLNRLQGDGGLFYGVNSWHMISSPSSSVPNEFDRVLICEFITCPKCQVPITIDLVSDLGIVFPVEDCGKVFEAARNKMVAVMRGVEQSCPNHTFQA
ncbi:MAG: hypothetical protein ACP5EP_11725 [Acidobacteriaceae bacterium]